ncbi:MAG TPA: hypothetical protein VGL10_09115 [Gammaproteobacteria bacterium]
MIRYFKPVLWCLFVVLVACGGSGGDGDSPESEPEFGSLTVTWDEPNTNADGTCPNDVAGYDIYIGTAMRSYSRVETVLSDAISCDGPVPACDAEDETRECTYTVNDVTVGTKYVALRVYNTSGYRSRYSAEVVKLVD